MTCNPIRLSFSSLILLPICLQMNVVKAQDSLHVIHTLAALQITARADPSQEMVDLQKIVPGIRLDLRYATANNFVGRPMYPENTHHTFMRAKAAKALAAVQKELKKSQLGLKIFEAYRPYHVTEKFWELVHDDRYVADPKKGSGHNRGIAADLTIIALKTGKEIEMPTGFDNFTDSAHQDFMNLPEPVLKNRALLRSIMEKYGFKMFATEWWHFSLPEPEKYDVLDIPFEVLEKQHMKPAGAHRK